MELGRERCKTFIFRFGVTEIVLGCFLTIFGIAVCVIGNDHYTEVNNGSICSVTYVLSVSAQGIWCGVFVVVTGVFGTVLKRKFTRNILTINLAMTFIACVLVFACFLMSVIAAVAAAVCDWDWIMSLHIIVAVACVLGFGILLAHAILCRNGILSKIYSSDTGADVTVASNSTALEMSAGTTYHEKEVNYSDNDIGQATPKDITKSVLENKLTVQDENLRSKDLAARASYMELGLETCQTLIFRFGVTEIVLGCIMIVFGIAVVLFRETPNGVSICTVASVLSEASQGIWCGVFVVVTGICGTVLRRKVTRKILTINLTMTFIACVLVFACFLMSVIAAVAAAVCDASVIMPLHLVVAVASVIAFGILLAHAILSRNGILSRIYSNDTVAAVKAESTSATSERSEDIKYDEKGIRISDNVMGQATPNDRTKEVPENHPNVLNENLRSKNLGARAIYMELGEQIIKTLIFRFGVTEIVLGCIMTIFGIAVTVVVVGTPLSNGTSTSEVAWILSKTSQGIWCGVFVVVSGVYGTACRKKFTKKILTVNLAMSFIACVLVFGCFIISIIAAVAAAVSDSSEIMSLHIVVAVACVIAFGILIAHAILSRNGILSMIYSNCTGASANAGSITTVSEGTKYYENDTDTSDKDMHHAAPKDRVKAIPDSQPTVSKEYLRSKDLGVRPRYVELGRERCKTLIFRFGVTEIVLGCIMTIFGIAVGATVLINRKSACSVAFVLSVSSQGLWCGVFLVATGVYGTVLRRKFTRKMFTINLAMTFIACVLVFGCFLMSVIASVAAASCSAVLIMSLHIVVAVACVIVLGILIVHAILSRNGILFKFYSKDKDTDVKVASITTASKMLDGMQYYEKDIDHSENDKGHATLNDRNKLVPVKQITDANITVIAIDNDNGKENMSGNDSSSQSSENDSMGDTGRTDKKISSGDYPTGADMKQADFPHISSNKQFSDISSRNHAAEVKADLQKPYATRDEYIPSPTTGSNDNWRSENLTSSILAPVVTDKREKHADGKVRKVKADPSAPVGLHTEDSLKKHSSSSHDLHKPLPRSDETITSLANFSNESLHYERHGHPPQSSAVTGDVEKRAGSKNRKDEGYPPEPISAEDSPDKQRPVSYVNAAFVGSKPSVRPIPIKDKKSQSKFPASDISRAAKYIEKETEISDHGMAKVIPEHRTKVDVEPQLAKLNVAVIAKDSENAKENTPAKKSRNQNLTYELSTSKDTEVLRREYPSGDGTNQIDLSHKYASEQLLDISSRKEKAEVTADLYKPFASSDKQIPSTVTVSNIQLRSENLGPPSRQPAVTEKLGKRTDDKEGKEEGNESGAIYERDLPKNQSYVNSAFMGVEPSVGISPNNKKTSQNNVPTAEMSESAKYIEKDMEILDNYRKQATPNNRTKDVVKKQPRYAHVADIAKQNENLLSEYLAASLEPSSVRNAVENRADDESRKGGVKPPVVMYAKDSPKKHSPLSYENTAFVGSDTSARPIQSIKMTPKDDFPTPETTQTTKYSATKIEIPANQTEKAIAEDKTKTDQEKQVPYVNLAVIPRVDEYAKENTSAKKSPNQNSKNKSSGGTDTKIYQRGYPSGGDLKQMKLSQRSSKQSQDINSQKTTSAVAASDELILSPVIVSSENRRSDGLKPSSRPPLVTDELERRAGGKDRKGEVKLPAPSIEDLPKKQHPLPHDNAVYVESDPSFRTIAPKNMTSKGEFAKPKTTQAKKYPVKDIDISAKNMGKAKTEDRTSTVEEKQLPNVNVTAITKDHGHANESTRMKKSQEEISQNELCAGTGTKIIPGDDPSGTDIKQLDFSHKSSVEQVSDVSLRKDTAELTTDSREPSSSPNKVSNEKLPHEKSSPQLALLMGEPEKTVGGKEKNGGFKPVDPSVEDLPKKDYPLPYDNAVYVASDPSSRPITSKNLTSKGEFSVPQKTQDGKYSVEEIEISDKGTGKAIPEDRTRSVKEKQLPTMNVAVIAKDNENANENTPAKKSSEQNSKKELSAGMDAKILSRDDTKGGDMKQMDDPHKSSNEKLPHISSGNETAEVMTDAHKPGPLSKKVSNENLRSEKFTPSTQQPFVIDDREQTVGGIGKKDEVKPPDTSVEDLPKKQPPLPNDNVVYVESNPSFWPFANKEITSEGALSEPLTTNAAKYAVEDIGISDKDLVKTIMEDRTRTVEEKQLPTVNVAAIAKDRENANENAASNKSREQISKNEWNAGTDARIIPRNDPSGADLKQMDSTQKSSGDQISRIMSPEETAELTTDSHKRSRSPKKVSNENLRHDRRKSPPQLPFVIDNTEKTVGGKGEKEEVKPTDPSVKDLPKKLPPLPYDSAVYVESDTSVRPITTKKMISKGEFSLPQTTQDAKYSVKDIEISDKDMGNAFPEDRTKTVEEKQTPNVNISAIAKERGNTKGTISTKKSSNQISKKVLGAITETKIIPGNDRSGADLKQMDFTHKSPDQQVSRIMSREETAELMTDSRKPSSSPKKVSNEKLRHGKSSPQLALVIGDPEKTVGGKDKMNEGKPVDQSVEDLPEKDSPLPYDNAVHVESEPSLRPIARKNLTSKGGFGVPHTTQAAKYSVQDIEISDTDAGMTIMEDRSGTVEEKQLPTVNVAAIAKDQENANENAVLEKSRKQISKNELNAGTDARIIPGNDTSGADLKEMDFTRKSSDEQVSHIRSREESAELTTDSHKRRRSLKKVADENLRHVMLKSPPQPPFVIDEIEKTVGGKGEKDEFEPTAPSVENLPKKLPPLPYDNVVYVKSNINVRPITSEKMTSRGEFSVPQTTQDAKYDEKDIEISDEDMGKTIPEDRTRTVQEKQRSTVNVAAIAKDQENENANAASKKSPKQISNELNAGTHTRIVLGDDPSDADMKQMDMPHKSSNEQVSHISSQNETAATTDSYNHSPSPKKVSNEKLRHERFKTSPQLALVIDELEKRVGVKDKKDKVEPPDPSVEDLPKKQLPLPCDSAAFVGRKPSDRPIQIEEKSAQHTVSPRSEISEAAKYFVKGIEISDDREQSTPKDRTKDVAEKQISNVNVTIIEKDNKNGNVPAGKLEKRTDGKDRNDKVNPPALLYADDSIEKQYPLSYDSAASVRRNPSVRPIQLEEETAQRTVTSRSEISEAAKYFVKDIEISEDRKHVTPKDRTKDVEEKQISNVSVAVIPKGEKNETENTPADDSPNQSRKNDFSDDTDTKIICGDDTSGSYMKQIDIPRKSLAEITVGLKTSYAISDEGTASSKIVSNGKLPYEKLGSPPEPPLVTNKHENSAAGKDTANEVTTSASLFVKDSPKKQPPSSFDHNGTVAGRNLSVLLIPDKETLRYEKLGCPPDPQSVTEKLNTDSDTTDEFSTSASLFVKDSPKNQPPLSFDNNGTVVGSNLSVLLIQDNEKTSQSEISMLEVSQAAKYFEKDVEISDSYRKQATLKDGTKEVTEKQIVMVHATGIENDAFANVPDDDPSGADMQQNDYPLNSSNEKLLNISSQKETVEVTVDLHEPHSISAECTPSMQIVSNENLRNEKLRSSLEPQLVTDKIERSARSAHNNENSSKSDYSVTEISEAAKYFVKEIEISDNEKEQGTLKYRTTSVTEYKTVNVDMTIIAKDIESAEETVQIQSTKGKSELNMTSIDNKDCVHISFAAIDKHLERQENTVEQLSSPISHWYGESTVTHQFHNSANVFKPITEMPDSSSEGKFDYSLYTRTSAYAHVFSVDEDSDTPIKPRAVGKLRLSSSESTVPDRASFDDTISQDSIPLPTDQPMPASSNDMYIAVPRIDEEVDANPET